VGAPGRLAIARYRRRRRKSRFKFIFSVLAIAAVVYLGGRFVLSPHGRYTLVTTLLGGGVGRVRPPVEAAIARAAEDLNLPTPYPQLDCQPAGDGTSLCSTVVNLTPGVSTLQGNAEFSRQLLGLGLDLVSGTENPNGSVSLRFQASRKVAVALELLPAEGTGLDTVITPAPDIGEVNVRGRLALIIEEYGEDRALSRRFAELPGTFTAAVRSNMENAEAWAKEARQTGMEVILDLPMEPKNYPTRNPGSDAILVDISGREIRKRFEKALNTVGTVKGVKIYMGSLAVEDRDVMRPILEEMAARSLYLVDPTTSEYSVVPELAREMEVPVYEVTSISQVDAGRNDEGTIGIRFDDLVRSVRAHGYALGIVHPKEGTLAVLADRLPGLAREGIVVMGLTEVMKAHALE